MPSRFLILPLDSFKSGWSGQSCLSNASAASSLLFRLKTIFHEQLVQVYDASLEVIVHAILRCDMPPRAAPIKLAEVLALAILPLGFIQPRTENFFRFKNLHRTELPAGVWLVAQATRMGPTTVTGSDTAGRTGDGRQLP